MDSPLGDDENSTLGEVVPTTMQLIHLKNLQSKSLIGDVNLVLSKLEPREADIIRLRFGLEGRDPTDSRRSRSRGLE